MDIQSILSNPEHHAYVVFSNTITFKSNPYIHFFDIPKQLSIEDVRLLQDYVCMAEATQKRFFIITASGISAPAQHALLKTLEELPKGASCIFCLPAGTVLLQTFTSRCFLVGGSTEENKNIISFFSKNTKERIAYIDDIWTKEESERHMAILLFLQQCEVYAHNVIKKEKSLEKIRSLVQIITQAREAIATGAFSKTTLQLFAFV